MDFKLIHDCKAVIAETPVWDKRINALYWTDFFAGAVRRFDPETGKEEVWNTHQPIGGAVLTSDKDKLLCALESGIFLLDLKTGMLDFLVNPEKRLGYKLNDTRVDPAGRIFTSSVSKYFGTPKQTPDMKGAFYMIDRDFSVTTLVSGITQYNGIVWNAGCTKMFVIDSENALLLEFPYSTEKGVTGKSRIAAELGAVGIPDGMSIDENDNIYICHWSGKVSVWNRNLSLINTIELPVQNLCCGGFGGKAMDTFFVATAAYGCGDEQKAKGAGGIFSAKAPIKGRSDTFFFLPD